MTVRREIVEPRRETSARRAGDWLRRLRSACPVAPLTGTGAGKKGASPQQYVEDPRGEPTGRRFVAAAFMIHVGYTSTGLDGRRAFVWRSLTICPS
jgi:hypothetical protein